MTLLLVKRIVVVVHRTKITPVKPNKGDIHYIEVCINVFFLADSTS